jgi:hypothetical protein
MLHKWHEQMLIALQRVICIWKADGSSLGRITDRRFS